MSTQEQHYLEPVFSQHVLELIRVGHEFCLHIEKADQYTADEWLSFIHKIFPMLYLKGLFLPVITPGPEGAGERYVTQEEWEAVYNNLRAILGSREQYWAVDPEITGGNEAVSMSLAENLTDIYQDIKDFIMQYQKASRASKEIAVAECRAWFNERWGKSIAQSFNYLHYLIIPGNSGSTYEDLF